MKYAILHLEMPIMSEKQSKSIEHHIEQSFLEMVHPRDVYWYFHDVVKPSILEHVDEYGQGDIVEYTSDHLPVTAADIYNNGKLIAEKYI